MVKKNYKLVVAFILVALISGTSVYAASTIIKSKDVSYDKTNSGGKYDNVQDAIDELYEKSGLLSEVWKDKTLNGADPVLDVEGSTKKLIPITIDNAGTVHYANLKTKWYDYSDKKWANAVLLVDNPKNGGEENYTYKTGDIILEEDIESYFVWIPRYSYKIWDMGQYNTFIDVSTLVNSTEESNNELAFRRTRGKALIIDIKFGDVSTNPKMSESQAQLNEYYTHPAFTLGDKALKGIWVGKFELGYNQNGNNGNPINDTLNWTAAKAQINGENSKRVIVKPNVNAWRGNTVQNFFLSLYNYNRPLESHMMKNIEWGAVAYLSHSVYGIGKEVNINNTIDYKTGFSSALNVDQSTVYGNYCSSTESKTAKYNSLTGYLASTTGNITGVYDMSGGSYEYLAAYLSGKVGNSGFTDDTELTTIYKNYFDVYSADCTSISYNKRILGDATGEMGPFYRYFDGDGGRRIHNAWYNDYSRFVDGNASWFHRGGNYQYGITDGQFDFRTDNGRLLNSISTRLVLSPN